jgi:hypothetical protein
LALKAKPIPEAIVKRNESYGGKGGKGGKLADKFAVVILIIHSLQN